MKNQSSVMMISRHARGFPNWMDLAFSFLALFGCCYGVVLAFASILTAYSSLVGLKGLGHLFKVTNCETWALLTS